MTKIYKKHNFHSHTFCVWHEVLFDEIAALKINYTSQSGSQYIFIDDGLYRISNHWGRVANCHWRLIPLAQFKNQNITVAFARWCDFYSNDDTSKLFFIRYNLDTQEVNFNHKLSVTNNEKIVLRNAKDTAKTIRNIKEILTSNDWAKYLDYENLETLRHKVVNELINTEKSFLEVKKEYLV